MGRRRTKSEAKLYGLNMSKTITQLTQFLPPPSSSIDISFKNISYSVSTSLFSSERKDILKDVSGTFKSGELTAIMGPSGAGKSSLLNVLSGFIKKGVKGDIYANDALVDEMSEIKSDSAYIMQDDFFNPLFTVNELMLQAAHLKLGHSSNVKSKKLLIEDILQGMSLSEAGNTLCSRLSGGQKKRLSVCLEMINNPSIIFLDEPTSGLDSSSCSLLISRLEGLARSGRTIICTIHQPSAAIFSRFDHLYMLSGGKTVYQGDSSNMLPFLNHIGLSCPIFHNPADFVMDVITGEFGDYTDKLIAATESREWRNNNNNAPMSIENGNPFITVERKPSTNHLQKPSEWMRYNCLVSKLIIQLHRDKSITYLRLLLHLMVGILIGILFYGIGNNAQRVFSNVGYYFICIAYMCFTSLMPAAIKFPSEVTVLKKEHFNNWYKFTTYFFALLTVNLPVQLLFSFVFTSVSYWLTGQMIEINRYFLFTAAICFSAIIAELLGLLMGTSTNAVNGIFNGSILMAIFVVLGGFIVFIKDLPTGLDYVSYFTFFRYCFEVMVTGLYGSDREKLDCPPNELYCYLRNPQMVLAEMGMNEARTFIDLSILFVYALVVAIMTYFMLRYKLKHCH